MSQVLPLFKREFASYFRSPVAYVFLIVFLAASVGLAFFAGNFFEYNQANLDRYFFLLPWLFILFAPAVGMRLWAEEKRTGTAELLFTLPVTLTEAVLGKFLAGWAFLALAVLLSFPMAMTIGFLGNPDWGVVLCGYLGSVLMAGGYLGVSMLMSALTKNQVIAFVLGVLVCFVLVLLGAGVFIDVLSLALPQPAVDAVSNFSFLTHFEGFSRGLIDVKDLVFFLSLMGVSLLLTALVLER